MWLTLCMHLNQSCRHVPPPRAGCWRQRRATPRSLARASRETLCAERLGGATPAVVPCACSRRPLADWVPKASMQRELCRYPGRENTERCAFNIDKLASSLLRSTPRQTDFWRCLHPARAWRCQHRASRTDHRVGRRRERRSPLPSGVSGDDLAPAHLARRLRRGRAHRVGLVTRGFGRERARACKRETGPMGVLGGPPVPRGAGPMGTMGRNKFLACFASGGEIDGLLRGNSSDAPIWCLKQ